MPLMTWNDSFSVGVDSMDTQHKKLFNLTNKLFDAMKEGRGKDILHGVLTELVSYTKAHLAAEEKLLQEHNYPGLADHKALHRQLLAKVSDYCSRFNAGDTRLTINLCEFLQDWLKTHILKEDKLYGQHIASQAVAAR